MLLTIFTELYSRPRTTAWWSNSTSRQKYDKRHKESRKTLNIPVPPFKDERGRATYSTTTTHRAWDRAFLQVSRTAPQALSRDRSNALRPPCFQVRCNTPCHRITDSHNQRLRVKQYSTRTKFLEKQTTQKIIGLRTRRTVPQSQRSSHNVSTPFPKGSLHHDVNNGGPKPTPRLVANHHQRRGLLQPLASPATDSTM